MSKIRENRIKKFKTLREENKSVRVYNHNDNSYGLVVADATPYQGEAGYSSRVKVLWDDGKTTTCTLKGMESYRKKHWKIL